MESLCSSGKFRIMVEITHIAILYALFHFLFPNVDSVRKNLNYTKFQCNYFNVQAFRSLEDGKS